MKLLVCMMCQSKPFGPPTVLTPVEESRLVQYVIEMGDMGFGLM